MFPQNGGYPIVVYNTIKGLLAQGHTVTLISLDEKQITDRHYESDDILEKIAYRHCSVDTRIGIFKAFISLFTAAVPFIDKYFDERADKILIDELRNNTYDIVQFEGLFVTPYLSTVKKHSKAKVIYRAHNIEHLVWQRIAQRKADPFKKIYLLLLAKRIKAYEINQLSRFDGIIAFTDQDKKCMLEYGTKAPVEILPISIELNKYQPDTSRTEFPSLFFLGSLGWMPNLEGIEWFIDNFHADLSEGDLRVRFYLAGNDIPETFDDYEVPGKIYIQGEVDDALDFVNNKAIMIVPLLSGGGMRVKIVEGMAMQKCIISTSLGAEGIEYTHGQNIIIANTRAEFFMAIKRCIADEQYCRRIGLNARKLVEERHNVTAVTNRLIEYYRHLGKP